jgi:hypothetical protein
MSLRLAARVRTQTRTRKKAILDLNPRKWIQYSI